MITKAFAPFDSLTAYGHLLTIPNTNDAKTFQDYQAINVVTSGLKSFYSNLRLKTPSDDVLNSGKYLYLSDEYGYPKLDSIESPKEPLIHKRYRILDMIAKGNVSILLKCEDTYKPVDDANRFVAIKVLHSDYTLLGVQESIRIQKLNDLDAFGDVRLLRLKNHFFTGSKMLLCMVFELLGNPVNHPVHRSIHPIGRIYKMNDLRKIATQLVIALAFLSMHDIIHADIKPENILLTSNFLRSKDEASVKLKLIDLGNAMTQSEAKEYFNDFEVQSLAYRAPEVSLGMPFGCPIDMWSIGCVLWELATGECLFKCTNRKSLCEAMINILGPFPSKMIENSKFGEELHLEQAVQPLNSETTELKLIHLIAEKSGITDPHFASLLSGMLCYDPNQRMKPTEALCHPFLTRLTPWDLFTAAVLKDHSKNVALQPCKQSHIADMTSDASPRSHEIELESLHVEENLETDGKRKLPDDIAEEGSGSMKKRKTRLENEPTSSDETSEEEILQDDILLLSTEKLSKAAGDITTDNKKKNTRRAPPLFRQFLNARLTFPEKMPLFRRGARLKYVTDVPNEDVPIEQPTNNIPEEEEEQEEEEEDEILLL